MANLTYAQAKALFGPVANGELTESIQERMLTLLAIMASGQNPDGSAWSGGGGSGVGTILGITSHALSSDSSYTTSSASFSDVDATNLSVVFTAPKSGNVLFTFAGVTSVQGGSPANGKINAREGTTNIGSYIVNTDVGVAGTYAEFPILGISAGVHTYKLGFATTAEILTLSSGPTYGPITIKVIQL